MRNEPRAEKKFIAVRGDLLQRVIEIANRDGKTVFGFVNEIFQQALRAEELKVPLSEIIDFYTLIEVMKKAGSIITTSDVFNHLITRLYPLEKEGLQEKWYVSGVWYGKYLAMKFNDTLEVFKKILEVCMWDVTEASLTKGDGGRVSLRCVAPSHTIENTELFLHFLRGVMHSFNYKIVREEFYKGIILMDLEERTPISDIELGLDTL